MSPRLSSRLRASVIPTGLYSPIGRGHAQPVTSLRVKLTFPEHLIKQPLMGRLVREFDVLPNIRRANIEESVGWIVCELGGEEQAVERALLWLGEAGVQVDRLGDVVES